MASFSLQNFRDQKATLNLKPRSGFRGLRFRVSDMSSLCIVQGPWA